MESMQLSEQRDTLLKRLADTEAENAVSFKSGFSLFSLGFSPCVICVTKVKFVSLFLLQHLVVKLQEKDKEVNQLSRLLDTEKVVNSEPSRTRQI